MKFEGNVVDIYWHTRKRMWSVRLRGLVVEHVTSAEMINVQFIVHEAARRRAMATGQRAVFAFAHGALLGEIHEPQWGTRVRLQPFNEAGFVTDRGIGIKKALMVHFLKTGTCLVIN